MGLFHSKPNKNHKQIVHLPSVMVEKIPDKNHKQIVDLPPRNDEEFFCYIPKKERMKSVSLVKKQWYSIINSKIENVLISSPTQDPKFRS